MVASLSVCSIIKNTLANKVLKSIQSARWIASERGKDLRAFSNETIKVLTKLQPELSTVKQAIASQFPDLGSRIGLSETHVVKSKLQQNFRAKLDKGRRIPFNLQPSVTAELADYKYKDILKNCIVF